MDGDSSGLGEKCQGRLALGKSDEVGKLFKNTKTIVKSADYKLLLEYSFKKPSQIE
jgi:hypothetical protein